jgi:hypothetical protein
MPCQHIKTQRREPGIANLGTQTGKGIGERLPAEVLLQKEKPKNMKRSLSEKPREPQT